MESAKGLSWGQGRNEPIVFSLLGTKITLFALVIPRW